MRRILGSLMVLALVLVGGCKAPAENADGPSAEGAPIRARSFPEIWIDLLAERDRVQAVISKGTDMWHPECKEVADSATRIDALAAELGSWHLHRLRQAGLVRMQRNGRAVHCSLDYTRLQEYKLQFESLIASQ